MHRNFLDAVIAQVKAREAEGDCPTSDPLPAEQLENAILELDRIVERMTITPRKLLRRARELFEHEESKTFGDVWGSLECAGEEQRERIGEALDKATAALDFPSWTPVPGMTYSIPNWEESYKAADNL